MKEIIHTLQSMKDKESIEKVISNSNAVLFDYLRLTNEETEKRWLGIYNDMIKGNVK